MPFKTILSVSGVDQDSADLLAVAELSERIGAHLDAFVIACAPPPPIGDVGGLAYSTWAQQWQTENARLDERLEELKQLLGDRSLSCDLQAIFTLRSSADEETGERARYADVTVVGSGLRKDDFLLKRVLDGALFQSPAPVILLPEGGALNLAPKTVLVAWNAGLEAGRAVRQAMDILMAAEDVRIVLVDPAASPNAMGEEPGADIAGFLARHGVKVTVEVLAGGGRETGEVLRQHAVDIDAGLIVMGAYGHSRMRERIFGGVTKSMIDNPGVPVLLAH